MTVCGEKLSGVCGASCTFFNICRNNEIANLPKSHIEWMREASIYEMAEFIVNLTLLDQYKLYDRMESAEYEDGIGVGAKKVIVEWLKEKHNGGDGE